MQLDIIIRVADTQRRIEEKEEKEGLIRQKQVDERIKEEKVKEEREAVDIDEDGTIIPDLIGRMADDAESDSDSDSNNDSDDEDKEDKEEREDNDQTIKKS